MASSFRAWLFARSLNILDQVISDNVNFAWAPSWQSLLSNGTVNNPAANNLTGIVYGDYYLIQNGNMLVEMGLAGCR